VETLPATLLGTPLWIDVDNSTDNKDLTLEDAILSGCDEYIMARMQLSAQQTETTTETTQVDELQAPQRNGQWSYIG